MKKRILLKIITFIMLFVALFILTGCNGALNDKEYDAIIEALKNEKIIENISNEETIGAGEMEYIKYKFDTTVSGIQYKATLVQGKDLKEFRIFSLYLDSEVEGIENIKHYIKIDKKCNIELYSEWQENWK